jgi:hypothetical protein
MEQNQTNNQTTREGFYVEPRAYLSRDGEYLTLVLPGNIIVRKHVNYYKQILGIVYTPKSKPQQEEPGRVN